MSATATRQAEVRASREVVVVSRRPWSFKVLSTDGTYEHELWWSAVLTDVVCSTCGSRHGQRHCWARARCLEVLRAEMQRRAAPAG